MTVEELVQTKEWMSFMKKLETFCMAAIVALLFLFLIGKSDTSAFRMLIVPTLTTLSTICFFMSFNKFESDSKILSQAFYKVYGLGLSGGFISIMFKLYNWPFPYEIAMTGSVIMILIALLLGIKERSKGNINNLDWKYFARIFLALIPLLIFIINSAFNL